VNDAVVRRDLASRRRNVIEIHSIDDERIALYHNIRNADLRGRGDVFIAESELVVRRLIESRFAIHSLLLSRAKLERMADAVAALQVTIPVYVADISLLSRIAGYRIHGGALALGVRPAADLLSLEGALRSLHGRTRLLLILAERITHVDNIGALFRNAAAFGADAVVLDSACADPLYRKAIRVSMGHVLSMPFAIAGDWPEAMATLRERWGMTIIAAESTTRSRPIAEIPAADRLGVVFGSERHGVSDATLALCDGVFHIPMSQPHGAACMPRVPSINVATAAAIVLHELAGRPKC
jgi:tRNA G18 (ribose-2'-O)-methylase SpoU